MSYQDIAHHYEDGPEDDAPTVLRDSEHTARKQHFCDSCEAWIEPGERYKLLILLGDDGFELYKSHAAPGRCAELRPQVEAWRQQQERETDYPF